MIGQNHLSIKLLAKGHFMKECYDLKWYTKIIYTLQWSAIIMILSAVIVTYSSNNNPSVILKPIFFP